MQDTANTETQDFVALAARVHPGLDGTASPSFNSGISCNRDNTTEAIEALVASWERAFPEAGQPYWSVRSWTLLIWQPVFIAVLGVHGVGSVPPIDRLWQRLDSGIVAGFWLPEKGWRETGADEVQRIERAGELLAQVRDRLLADLSGVIRLKRLSAYRLMADTLLAALATLENLSGAFTHERIQALADQWLAATGLSNQSQLMPLTLAGGQPALGLDRKACCMHYRRDDGCYCASCPKLTYPERVQRQLEELSHEAVAV